MSTPASWAMRSELAPLQAIAPRLVTLPPLVSSVTPVERGVDAEHRVAEAQRASGGGDPVGEGAGDLAVVDDPALGDVQRLAPDDVRLDLACLRVARRGAGPAGRSPFRARAARAASAAPRRSRRRRACRSAGTESRSPRQSGSAARAPRGRGGCAASRACSRAPRGSRRSCGRSGGRRSRPPCRRSRCAARAAAAGARAPSRARRSRRRSRSGRAGRSSPARV